MTQSSTNPLVSFIIPSYNTGKFILQTLENALAVDWPNKEIIVIDDGSTDGTAELVKPLGDKIRYIYQENRGLSGARNTGIRSASGEYFVFLDADDLVEPNFLQVQVGFLESHPQVDISYSLWSFIDDNGNLLPEKGNYRESGTLLTDLVLFNRFPVMSALVRRRVIDRVGMFDEANRSGEDWDFWLRAAAAGVYYQNIPIPLVYYRIHGTNMSLNPRWFQNIVAVLEKFFATPGLPVEVLAMQPLAYSRVHLTYTNVLYRIGRNQEAVQSFIDGTRLYPGLLTREDTYYALICAHQPPGYRDTSFYKDLLEADARINRLLQEVFECFKNQPKIASLRKQAVAVKELTFAQHAYQAGNTKQARKHILAAGRSSFAAVANTKTLKLLVRSYLGQDTVNRLKKWLKR